MSGKNSSFRITKTMKTKLSLIGKIVGPYGHFSVLLKGFSSLNLMGQGRIRRILSLPKER